MHCRDNDCHSLAVDNPRAALSQRASDRSRPIAEAVGAVDALESLAEGLQRGGEAVALVKGHAHVRRVLVD